VTVLAILLLCKSSVLYYVKLIILGANKRNLTDNNLSGQLTTALLGLSKLNYLYLYSNMLTGTLSSELALLSTLEDLYFTIVLLCSGVR
jgi:hypothetical protein